MKNLILFFTVFAVTSLTDSANAQEPENVATFAIGSYEVSVLSEGQQTRKCDNLVGITPQILQKYAPDGTYPLTTNAFLVHTPEHTILIDAGRGKNLMENLKELEVAASQIDVILLTHMHGDHIGGLLNAGKVTFPAATVYLPQPEYDYWMNDQAMQQAPESRRNSFLQARAVIKAYGSKLHLFHPVGIGGKSTYLFPGIQGIAMYGHTPGHTGYLIESDNSRLLVWGDLTHAMTVQMPHPEVAFILDTDPAQAVAVRRRVLDYAVTNKIPVAGMHVVFPAIGDVKAGSKEDGEFAFEPFCLCLSY